MSSSSPEDEDCIVAVKFLGPQLSLCRPAQRDCKWSNIRISDPSFFSSHVMYSKRDEMFSMPSSRGNYTRSWDLGRHMKEPKLQMLMQLPGEQIPKMTKREWQRLESCCTKQHYLVESVHTDETFMLKWYTQKRPPPTLNLWDHFLVLKLDKEGNAVYTKDIGDLCILLSKSEPICIPAKLNRRAKNCIYMLTEHEFAIVSVSSNQKLSWASMNIWFSKQSLEKAQESKLRVTWLDCVSFIRVYILRTKLSRNQKEKREAAMAHLVRRLKLSKLSLGVSHLNVSQCFSNFIFKVAPCGSTLRDGDVGYLAIYSYIDNLIDYTPKKVPMELAKEMGTVGASHGWVATLKNGVVCLQDDLDPHASYTDPKRISLPPLVTLPHCQTQVVTNVAMSSSSLEDEDCIVAVKFLGPQLSLCRPAQRDCKWSNIRITDPSFFSSHVMYSKRDEMFSMPSSGGNYTGSWDLGRHMTEPKVKMLSYPEQREVKGRYAKIMDKYANKELLRKCMWLQSDSCCRMEHYLVESSHTSETFLVKWYTYISPKEGVVEWDKFLVYRIDEEGNAVYTEDFGGVCIFLSKAEPFCLPAACLHDQRPNCIYHLSKNSFGIKCMDDIEKETATDLNFLGPFWFPPKLDSKGKRILSSSIHECNKI